MKRNFKRGTKPKSNMYRSTRMRSNGLTRPRKAPFVSTGTQRYGPGYATTCCNGLYTFNSTDTSIVAVSLPSVALGSPEYPLYGAMYKWYKLKSIAITFLPKNVIDEDTGVFFQVQWKRMTDLEDTANIELDDNSKYVSGNILRPLTFHFKPPSAVITTFQNTSYNFDGWMPASSSAQNWPISLYYKKRGLTTIDWTINVQFFIHFRGSNLINMDATKLTKLVNTKTPVLHYKIPEKEVAKLEEPPKIDIEKYKLEKELEEAKEKEKETKLDRFVVQDQI